MRFLPARIVPIIVFGFCVFAQAVRCATYYMENLGRGVVAIRTSTTQVYVGWRLLGTDPSDVRFNLYRSIGGAEAEKINRRVILATTDYTDTLDASVFADTVSWYVRPVIDGEEQEASAAFTLPADAPVRPYLSIPLQVPPGGITPDGEAYTYSANDTSIGDLDGDGEYEFIVKWDPSNAKDNASNGYTGNVFLDAYRLDGTRLWRIDLGRNIRAGAHYTQFMVYDLDGDGRAEVACKTADGTTDGLGNVIGDASADYRNSSGRILDGPEYLTLFDGLTGEALATTDYVPARGSVSDWGDNYGNRVDRFLAGVAYLDGERPSLIMARGYYTQTHVVAWDWRDRTLTRRWYFQAANDSPYAGQGNHQLSVADVDGDGKQEIIYGSMVIDDDGTGLYTTGLGHGDALHVGKFDPSREGLQVFAVHESMSSSGNRGATFRDAGTGEIIWSSAATGDTGRGVIMDIDPNYPGAESWASNSDDIYAADGTIIGQKPSNIFTNFAVWWDADLLRELLDGTTISKLGYGTSYSRSNLLTAWTYGAASNNSTKSTPCLSGDILGDWREEVVWRNSDSTALLVFTTTIAATNRLYTFLHDPQYRVALAWQNVGYNQPPHPGFFVGAGMDDPPVPDIRTDTIALPREADSVVWSGAGTGIWAYETEGDWLLAADGTTVSYISGDTVRFDDTAATASVAIPSAVAAAAMTVDSGLDFGFSGEGAVTVAGTLTKTGEGTLTLGNAGANTFGSIVLEQGGLHVSDYTAAGSATIVLTGGTLTLNTASTNATISGSLQVDGEATVNVTSQHYLKGAVTGAGTLHVNTTRLWTLQGATSGFSGRLDLGESTGTVRLYGPAGSSSAVFDLGSGSASLVNRDGGTSYVLGALEGGENTTLSGAGSLDRATTWTIGGAGRDMVFSGTISDGSNSARTTAITKVGSGTLSLGGTSTHTGATQVSEGRVVLSGTLASSPVTVLAGAGFGGSGVAGGDVTFADGSTLVFAYSSGGGAGGLTVNGTLAMPGSVLVAPVLADETEELQPGTYTIIEYTGTLAGAPVFTWGGPDPEEAGLTVAFDTGTEGVISLVLTSTLTSLEQWRLDCFGTTDNADEAADTADPDGDGIANLLEYAFGGDPLAPDVGLSPRIAAVEGYLEITFYRNPDTTLDFAVEATTDLSAEWTVIWSSLTEGNAGSDWTTVRDVEPIAAHPRRFLRVTVSY